MKRLTALGILAVTFTLLGVLFASRMEWTQETVAQSPQAEIAPLTGIPALLTPGGESPFVAVADKVKPAVVNITAKKEEKGRGDNFDQSPFGFPFPDFHPQVPRGVTSGGSGIIVDKEGYILTNNHVVGGAQEITVTDANGHKHPAEIVGTDPESDVAVIRVKDSKFSDNQVAELGNSDDIKVADWAIAIGAPFGLEGSVTVGVISAKGRSNLAIAGGGPSYQNFIQTDASINFGNSGGPLVNIRGQVIGVNTAINTQGQGIGFAIPINIAKSIMDQLRGPDHQVTRGYLGLVPREIDDAAREALKIPTDVKGILVDMVEEGTPADKGGLQAGDVITAVNGQLITDPTGFRFLIAGFKPGSNVALEVLRDGKSRNMKFELGNRKDAVALRQQPRQEKENVWLGLHVLDVDSPQARQFDVQARNGVLVTDVDFNSPAEGKIEPGDVIVEINRKPIADLRTYRRIVADFDDSKGTLSFRLMRGNRETFEFIKP
jgi:Do/DeqQ family serine protease